VLGCDDGIVVLVEPHVAGLEEFGELVAVFEAIETARPPTKMYTPRLAQAVFPAESTQGCPAARHRRRDGYGDSREQR